MVKTVGIAVAAMLAGAAATYFLVSPPTQVAAESGTEAAPIAQPVELTPDIVEVPIDTFNISNRNASPGSCIHLRFRLVAAVPAGQEGDFTAAVTAEKPARIRQAILNVARNCRMEDIRDAELRVIKRQMKEEINKVLRKSLVSEVIISEFRSMDQ